MEDTRSGLPNRQSRDAAVSASREILIDMWTQERTVLRAEQDTDDIALGESARDALWSATESPDEFPAWLITCSVEVARELHRWADAGVNRWLGIDLITAEIFRRARKQVAFGLWRTGEDPPTETSN
jgi:hypothetical protein